MMPFQYTTGGTLAPDAPSYIERQADADLLRFLLAGRFCYVLNSRQMGKSSLCVRTMGVLGESGCHTAFVDLTKLGGKNITPEQWYVGIANEIGRELGLRSEFLAYWKQNSEFSPIQRLFGAIRDVALEKLDGSLAIFVDEIDATRSLSFSTDEFFAAIREGHNRRVQDPALHRLTFCLLGVAVPSDLINSPTSTPFNIGERIHLQDFTVEEALRLASGLARPGAEEILRQVHSWTNGQPFLTQSLCAAIAADETIRTPQDVDAMVKRDLIQPEARETNINLADVANRTLHAGDLEPDPEKFRADLLSAYERAWRGKPLADDEANRVAALLKLSGIMRSEGNQLKVRNRIYASVFGKDWIAENMPGQELRRQRRSFWKGVLRTALVGAAVVGIVSYFAFLANRAQRTAEAAKKELDYQLYVAKMNNLQLFDQEGNGAQMAKILEETKDSPHRGWEWGYWNGVLHEAKEEYALDPAEEQAVNASFSPDGKQILIPSRQRRSALLVDRKTKRVVNTFPLAPDEVLLPIQFGWVTVADRKEGTVMRDVLSEHALRLSLPMNHQNFPQPHHGRPPFVIVNSYSAGSSWFANTVFDCSTGQPIRGDTAKSVNDSKLTLSMSRDASLLLVSSAGLLPDVGKRVYEVINSQKSVLDRFSIGVASCVPSLSASGRYFVVGQTDRLFVRDLSSRKTVTTIDTSEDGASYDAAFDRTESTLVYLTDKNRIIVWSISRNKRLRTFRNAYSFDLSPTSDEMVINGTDNSVRVVSLNPIDEPSRGPVYGVRIGRDNAVIMGERSFDVASNEDLSRVRRIEVGGGGMVVSEDARIYATFIGEGAGRRSVLRETSSNKILLESKEGWMAVETAGEKRIFATLSADSRTMAVYRFGDREPLWAQEANPPNLFRQISVSADGARVLVIRAENVDLVEADTGKVLKSHAEDYATGGFLGASYDYYVAPRSTAIVYDGRTYEKRFELPVRTSVWSLFLSPDGRRLLSVEPGGTTVWDIATQARVARFNRFTASGFTRDGTKLLGLVDNRLEIRGSVESDPTVRIGVPSASAAGKTTKSP